MPRPALPRPRRRATAAALAVGLALLSASCARSSGQAQAVPAVTGAPVTSAAAVLRLGYFANVTHATAVHGVASGGYAAALGSTRLAPQVFNAGPAAVEALFAGSLDAAYLGPNPAVNAFVKSRGEAVRIVSGASSGGASLVVAPSIASVEGLRGKVVAVPQSGGTQDIALRTWLAGKGVVVDRRGGGDVMVRAQENAQSLLEFRAGRIAGAWVPEPWASRLVLDGGGSVLVDERALWPGGRFVTTHLVVRTRYLAEHPQTVEALLRAHVASREALQRDPAAGQAAVNQAVGELTGKPLSPAVLSRAFAQLELTDDPLASTLRASAEHAFATGLVARADLTGIYDLRLLRTLLGKDVDDDGLER